MSIHKGTSVSFYILEALILFQAVSGLFGGAALMLDPTGSMLQMPLDLLAPSPFSNYLAPGIILFVVLGLFPSIVFYGLLVRREWAWLGTVLIGIALIIWIGVEIAMIGYHSQPPLQLIYGITGLLIFLLASLPSTRKNLR